MLSFVKDDDATSNWQQSKGCYYVIWSVGESKKSNYPPSCAFIQAGVEVERNADEQKEKATTQQQAGM